MEACSGRSDGGGVVADDLGRSRAFILACIASIIGSCGIIFGSVMWVLNAGRWVNSHCRHVFIFKDSCRFVNGFYVTVFGLFSLLVPVYISEIAPTSPTCNSDEVRTAIRYYIYLVWLGFCSSKSCCPCLHLLLCVRLWSCTLGHDVRGHAISHSRPCYVSGHFVELAVVRPPVTFT